MRTLVFLFLLSSCGGLAWNTTVADHPQVRYAMLSSLEPGKTTEAGFRARWGNPTQKIREGSQVAYVYRNMTNPEGYLFPQFGDSTDYVVVLFQYGIATTGFSSDTEGCRATFSPRPLCAQYSNPSTVKPVNCGIPPGANLGRDKGLVATLRGFPGTTREVGEKRRSLQLPMGVTEDVYSGHGTGNYK